MKNFDKDYISEYERKFNAYMNFLIKNAYLDYLKEEKKRNDILSLNIILDDEKNLLDTIVGEMDIYISEPQVHYEEIELYMGDEKLYSAIKSLSENEKLVIFLYIILEKSRKETAKIMGYKDERTVNSVCRRSIKKIKQKLADMEGL